MKLIARAVAALTLLSFATPALPCGDTEHATTTAKTEKTDKKDTKVAKSGAAQKKSATAKKSAESKPATTAAN